MTAGAGRDVSGAPGGGATGLVCPAWGGGMEGDAGPGDARRALGHLVEAVLASRGEANAVFDILAVLQVGARVVWRGLRPGPRVRDQNGGLLGLGRSGTWSRMGADNCEVESRAILEVFSSLAGL